LKSPGKSRELTAKAEGRWKILLFFALVLLLSHPLLILKFTSRSPYGGNRDSLLIMSIIDWHIHQIKHLRFYNLWHMNFFYPNSYATFYTHHLLGHAFLALPIGLMTDNPHIIYNFLILFFLFVGMWGSFLLLRELTENREMAALFSTAYAFATSNYVNFVHINILSHTLIPLFLFFFVKYLKTKRELFLLLTGFWGFLVFFFSTYMGTYLLGLFLPIFLAALLLEGELRGRDFLKTLGTFALTSLAILAVFYPYLIVFRRSGTERLIPLSHLVGLKNLLVNNSWLAFKIYAPFFRRGTYPLSLGMFLTLGVISFLFRDLRRGPFLSIFVWLLLILSLILGNLALTRVIFILLIGKSLHIIFKRKALSPMERIFLLTTILYSCIFFNFSTLAPSIKFSPYYAISSIIPGMKGLRAPTRSYLLLYPLLLYFSIEGFKYLLGKINSPGRKTAFLCLLFPLIFLENYYPEAGFYRKFPSPPQVYHYLPREENRVILEIPFYRGLLAPRNNLYNFYSRVHWNYLINGRAAFYPQDYPKARGRANSKKFLVDRNLRWFLRNYSVNFIIIHWDLIKNQEWKELLKRRVKEIRKYGVVLKETEKFTLIKVIEREPVRVLVRRYSTFHLRRKKLHLILKRAFQGKIRVYLNGRFLLERKIGGMKEILLDFRKSPLERNSNRVKIVFSSPVRIEDVTIM